MRKVRVKVEEPSFDEDVEDTKVSTAPSHVEKVLTNDKYDVTWMSPLLLLIHSFLMSYDMLHNSLLLEQLLLRLVLNLVNIKFLHGLFLMLMYPFYVCWYSTIGYLASGPVMNGYGFAYPSCLMILSNLWFRLSLCT